MCQCLRSCFSFLGKILNGLAVGLGYFLHRALSPRIQQNVLATIYAGCLCWALATLAYPIPRGRNFLAETAPLIETLRREVPEGRRWLLVVSPQAPINPLWPNSMLTGYYELSGPVNRGVIQQILFYTRRHYRPVHAEDLRADTGPERLVFGQDRYLAPGSRSFLQPLLKGPDWTLYRFVDSL